MLQVPWVYYGTLQNHFPQFPCVLRILFISLPLREPQQGFFKFLNHALISHTETMFFYTLKELFGAVATYRLNFDGGEFQKLWITYWTNKHERQCKENYMSSTKLDYHKWLNCIIFEIYQHKITSLYFKPDIKCELSSPFWEVPIIKKN